MSRFLIQVWAKMLLRLKWPTRPTSAAEAWFLAALLTRRVEHVVPPDMWAKVANVAGFLSHKEGGFLFWAASRWKAEGPVIGLGSYQGKSTILLALAGRHVHAVDAWGMGADASAFERSGVDPDVCRELFMNNIRRAGVEHLVTVHQGRTSEVADGWTVRCAVMYIDAGHSYDDVSCDVRMWQRHLAQDGILIMHDVLNMRYPGVFRAAAELYATRRWRIVGRAGSLVAFMRRLSQR